MNVMRAASSLFFSPDGRFSRIPAMALKHDIPTRAYASAAASSAEASPVIECRALWKIFGDHRIPAAVRKSILAGEIGVEEARCEYDCVVAVQDISFSVPRGEIFCVMGMSGSGKSTLIRHINRLIEPSASDVLIDEQSVRSLNARDIRILRAKRVGMVFQNMALLPHRTVESHAGLSLELRNIDSRERGEIVQRVLEVVGLAS
ncbi:MAG: ATP-binding cassette domain-containing protein [Paralcaligenes sp.]